MYTYYVLYIYIYVLHIFDDANCIPIMIPIVDGESNVCSFLLSIGQIPSFMYVVKKTRHNQHL